MMCSEELLCCHKKIVEKPKAPTSKVIGVWAPVLVCKLGLLQPVDMFSSRCLTSFVSQHRRYPPWIVVRCGLGLETAIQISTAGSSSPAASGCCSLRMTGILRAVCGREHDSLIWIPLRMHPVLKDTFSAMHSLCCHSACAVPAAAWQRGEEIACVRNQCAIVIKVVVKSLSSGSSLPEFHCWLWNYWAMWPWCWLNLDFLTHKIVMTHNSMHLPESLWGWNVIIPVKHRTPPRI